MTPSTSSDKYAERAREAWGQTSCDIAYRDRDIAVIARALGQAELEARIEQLEYDIDVFWKDHDVLDYGLRELAKRLRTRLAELRPEQEGKDAKA